MLLASLLGISIAAKTPRVGPLIIPRPKQSKWTGADWILPAKVTIVIGSPPLDRVAAEAIQREIVAYGGQKPLIQMQPPRRGPFIGIGEAAQTPWMRRALGKKVSNVPPSPEGYWIDASEGRVLIAGRTSKATLGGAESLCQMIHASGSSLSIPVGRIRDWPTLGWRGVHLFLGNKALHFHKKLIVNILNRFKINHLVLECEEIKWDAIGDAAPDWAMTKADLKEEVAFARSHGITVVPLLNSIGHMNWLLKNKRFGDLAEDPKTKAVVSPSNPRTYKLIKAIYAEALPIFQTPVLHIGADEVSLGSRYPFKSASKYPLASDLFVSQVQTLNRMLRGQGVRTAMWADMLYSKQESPGNSGAPTTEQAVAIRKGIPKKTILFEWRYRPEGAPERLAILKNAGFKCVVGATWLRWPAIQANSKALADNGFAGLLSTTWVGYNSQEKNIYSHESDFSAMIVVAEESWNGGTIPLDQLGYGPAVVLRKAYALPMPKP